MPARVPNSSPNWSDSPAIIHCAKRCGMVLIAAQYRAGRQADALRSYDAVRSILIETLGVEPSPELQELHRRVLNHDPTLRAAPVSGRAC